MKSKRLIFGIGLSLASVGAEYGGWGVLPSSRGGDSTNIDSGIAILLGGVLLLLGAAVMLSTRVVRSRSGNLSPPRRQFTPE